MGSLICRQVKSVRDAEENGVAVDHQLLDNVRACSSTPHAAAAFFCAVLHPSPTARLTSAQALKHPYLRRCVSQMKDSYHAAQTSTCASTSVPHAPSTNILGRLASVPSSGLKVMKTLVSQALPGNSSGTRSQKARLKDMARYFPEYVHPSSDAELSAYQACNPITAALPTDNFPTDVRQLMAGMSQLKADFDLRPAIVAPLTSVPAASSGVHPIMHAKVSPGTDSAAAALQLQRQLYPASPLSAGSGFIPAIHSVRAQPFGSLEGGSHDATRQEHSVTPGQEGDERHDIPPSSPVDEPQFGSTQPNCKVLHTMEAEDPSAQDCAASGSAGPAAQPSAAVSEASKAEEDRTCSEQTNPFPRGSEQGVVEHRHSEMQDMLMTEPQTMQTSWLLTAAVTSGSRTTAVGNSGPDTSLRQNSLVSHDTHEDQLCSPSLHVGPEVEEEVGGIQPSQSAPSLPVEVSDQTHVQLPSQPSDAMQNAEDVAVGATGKSLKSHALRFCHCCDEDLDVRDQFDVDNHGPGSKCNCPGMEDAVNPNLYPNLNESVPLQQAQQPQVPLYRSVATSAYCLCSSCLTSHSMAMQPC